MDYETILEKISNNTVTAGDFNQFILESKPASVDERIRRRTRKAKKLGINDKSGHSRLNPMGSGIAARTHPKIKPNDPMGNGATRQGHKASTQAQRRKIHEGRVDELLEIMKDEKLTLEQLHERLSESSINLQSVKETEKQDGRVK
jgi:hypothetical protein